MMNDIMNLNRTIAPAFKLPNKIPLPVVNDIRLQNGLLLSTINVGTADVLRFSIVFAAGTRYQSQFLVASSTLNMLAEGTDKYTSEEIAEQLDFYGASVDFDIDRDWSCFTFYSLARHFEKVMEIAEQIIKYPVFPEKELNIYKQNQKQQMIIEREKVATIARESLASALFGKNHCYGAFAQPDDYDKLNHSMLKEFHEKYYSSSNAFIVVSGKVSDKEIKIISDCFGKDIWGNTQKTKSEPQEIITSSEKIIHIPKADSLQSAIRIGKVLFNKTHADYCGMFFLNTVLGGYFGSRLMKNIREEKGYTYGIYSNIVSMRDSGYLTISAEVGNEYVELTLKEIKNEILRLQQQKITKDELSLVKNYITGDILRSIDGAWKIADIYIDVRQINTNLKHIEQIFDEALQMTPERILDLANKYLDTNTLTTIISGRR
ncbi:MAG: insulinase family protein [Prevotellaceae bacterium]|jgi:predicted Zn-dependent peptidase|nr:insulinase family protein [Prevotellaceae bacterium]